MNHRFILTLTAGVISLTVGAWTPPKEALQYPLLLNQDSGGQIDSGISVSDVAAACIRITGGRVTYRYNGNQQFTLRCERTSDDELFIFMPSVLGHHPAFALAGIVAFDPRTKRAQRFTATEVTAFMDNIIKRVEAARQPTKPIPTACGLAEVMFGDVTLEIIPKQGYESALIRAGSDRARQSGGDLRGMLSVERGGIAIANRDGIIVGMILESMKIDAWDPNCDKGIPATIKRVSSTAFIILNGDRPVGTIQGRFPHNGLGIGSE